LLRFAAESPKVTPDDVIHPLLATWDATESEQWSPAIAAEFWTAYSKLCDMVKPVTIDSIVMGRTAPGKASRAQAHARRYLFLLLVLVGFAVVFGFIAGAASKLSDEVQQLVSNGDKLAPKISGELVDIKADLDGLDDAKADSLRFSLDDSRIPREVRKKIEDLRTDLQSLYRVCDQLKSKAGAISRVTAFQSLEKYEEGDLSRLPVLDNGFDNVRNYYQTRRQVAEEQQKVALLNGIYNALVPLLLGAVGAATYVLRLISEQIKDSTFTSTSPIRHIVRVALGCLAGLVVGLGGFNNELNLSSAALSFLAGYAVEPVFATLDSVAEKFRRS
jgi:hypothetical protein